MSARMIKELVIDTPVGLLKLESDGKYLLSLSMESSTKLYSLSDPTTVEDEVLADASQQLAEYFRGELTEFTVPVRLSGTDFRTRVWQELTRIPYGHTVSYGELAERVGSPKASRAVGMANHFNPIGIIVPCHRVIGANGKLTGYAGGLWRKQLLLDLERPKSQPIRSAGNVPQLSLKV